MIDGRVGIVTAAPVSDLHVAGPSASGAGVLTLGLAGLTMALLTAPPTIYINIDSDNNAANEVLIIAKDRTGSSGGTQLFRVQESGDVGIGTINPAQRLHVNQSAEGNVFRIDDTTNTCDMDPDASVVDTCASDARLKENIREAAPVLDYLTGIKLRDFEWIASNESDTGVVAQEIMEDYPELISMNENGYYMAQSITSWKLLKAIQEQQSQIEQLKQEIEQLKNK